MATILIKPVSTTTRGNSAAELTGIEASGSVTIAGAVTSGGAAINVEWDVDGNCINHHDRFNLDTAAGEVRDVLDTARKLADLEALEKRVKALEDARAHSSQVIPRRLTKIEGVLGITPG